MFETETIADNSFLQQNQRIFGIYNIYRVVLCLILLTSFLFESNISFLGATDPTLFYEVTGVYLLFSVLVPLRVFLPLRKSLELTQYVVIIVVDILFLSLISYTCGGVTSGMPLLLLVPIATVSMIVQKKEISSFIAAIGTIAAIYTEFYLALSSNQSVDSFIQAGLFGAFLFATSLLLQYLRGVISSKELITQEQAGSIQSLEEMNFQIIQKMQTGVIVVDAKNEVLKANSASLRLLLQDSITSLPAILLSQLEDWKKNNNTISSPTQISNSSPKIQTSFSYLQQEADSHILVFLEDYSTLTRRVQQLKLMSLGRLTASIAHEIRNPLGAIKHASQLLGESDTISHSDERLVEIIDTHSIRVNSLIEDILQLSRNKDSVPEIISLKPWLNNFNKKLSNSFKDDIHVEIDLERTDITVRFNQSQLEQVMTNLCENGIRASVQHTQKAHILIKVRVNSFNQSPIIEIIDDGIGVPNENIEEIFEPFFTTENSGTGLGLFICKEICEANQAQLSYDLNTEQQSCFRISFAHPGRNILKG